MTNNADRVWAGSMPEVYERLLGPTVFQPFAVDLAERAKAHRPRRVLELAAGTGLVTRQLATTLPSARIVATDLNDGMVEFGRAHVPAATWQQADALDLPFEAGDFDLVVCQFGVMFFPDKPDAFAQARRVLAPDGVLLFNTWGPVDTHDFAAPLVDALTKRFPDDPPRFMQTIPHGYSDIGAIRADLAAGGLHCTEAEAITLQGHAPSAAAVAEGFCTGTPVRAEVEARGGDIAGATAAVAAAMQARLGAGPVVGRMQAAVVEATPAHATR